MANSITLSKFTRYSVDGKKGKTSTVFGKISQGANINKEFSFSSKQKPFWL